MIHNRLQKLKKKKKDLKTSVEKHKDWVIKKHKCPVPEVLTDVILWDNFP